MTAVQLRAVSLRDLETFFDHQRDEEAARLIARPSRDRAAFFALWERILRGNGGVERTILVDGEVAGNLVCFDAEGERHVGYILGRAFWGRGIATRALALFLAEIVERPLVATVAAHNVASRRVLERNGFRAEGSASEDGVEILRFTLA